MPIFEYHCDDCGVDFERLLKNRDEDVACECGSSNVQKLMSVFAAHNAAGGSGSTPMPQCTSCCQGGSCGLS
jgi:putative FmdB family regulatory protein